MTALDRTQWIIGGSLGILLIHGLGGSPAELAPLSRALADAGHTVCSVQLAGHGRGEVGLGASTSDDWRDSALAAHAVLARRCETVIVAGLSMGALLALEIARLRPKRVHGLVLLAPALRLDGWAMPRSARHAGSLPASLIPAHVSVAERHPYGIKDERIRGLVQAAMQSRKSGSVFSTPLRALIAFQALANAVRRTLHEIRQPTLIIHPRDDDMASPSNAYEIASRISGLTDMLILDDSYHLVTLDRQRRLVQERVVAFAARLGTGRQHERARARAADERPVWPPSPTAPGSRPQPSADSVMTAT
jgi:carboxylesterase